MNKTLVSIIIPTYNRAGLLRETIASVSSQTYRNWECIIVDDGSTDNTEEIITAISEKDNRIRFYSRPFYKKNGASSCRNFGLEKSRGELVQFLDSDDLLHKTKLMAQVNSWKDENSDTLITCKWGGFEKLNDLDSRFKHKYNSYRNFNKSSELLNYFGLYNEFFPVHVYLTPRKLIEKAGIWNEEITNNDDAEFFTRVILNSSKIVFAHDAKAYYRYFSPGNLSAVNSTDKIKSLIKSWILIEETLKNKGLPLIYVKRAKYILFKIFQQKQPRILLENKGFFRGRRNYDKLNFKIYKKIKSIFEQ